MAESPPTDYSEFFALSPHLLAVIGKDARFLRTNPAWQKISGYAENTILGACFIDFLHSDDQAEALETVEALFSKDRTLKSEISARLRLSSGKYRTIRWCLAFSFEPNSILVMSEEVSEPTEHPAHLFNSQQQLAIFDSIPEGVIVRNRSGKVIQFNQAALDILGLTKDELSSSSPQDASWRVVDTQEVSVPPENYPAVLALKTGKSQVNQILGISRLTEPTRWLSITAVPLFTDGRKEPYQVLATFRDTTEKRRATAELQKIKSELENRESFLKATLSALPDLVSYLDRNLIYRYVNGAYSEWFGMPTEEIVGSLIEKIVGSEVFAAIQPRLLETLAGNKQHFQQILPYQYGSARFVDVKYLPDVDTNGAINGIYVIVRDVSSEVQAKKTIEKKEKELAKFLDGIPSLIGYWDKDLKNLHANRMYAQFFSLKPEEIKGKHIAEVLGPDLFEANRPYLEGVLRGEDQIFQRDLRTTDGVLKHTLAHYIPDRVDGRIEGFFVVVTDISRLKQLEDERRQFESKLIFASKMSSLGEMAGGISHEINNPLAIIKGKASILKRDLEKSRFETERFSLELDKIVGQVDRIDKIIRGLRAFARNAERDPRVPAKVSQIITDTLAFCREKMKDLQIELRVNIDETIEVECRTPQISQILINLLSNSFDALEKNPEKWIEIRTEQTHDSARISITDSGRGILPEVASKMMQPFYTTKDIGRGTGLGLSISKGLAEENGGKLTYHAEMGRTCFTLELPSRRRGHLEVE